MRMVPQARSPRLVAIMLLLGSIVFCVLAAFLPWQQTVAGSGRVIAWAPQERRQLIEAPVEGRVAQWFVEEGQHVNEGDPIVEITDNDPELMERLEEEREVLRGIVADLDVRVRTLSDRIQSITSAQSNAAETARQSLRATVQRQEEAQQNLEAADASLETALLQRTRVQVLHEQGLVATRDLELAILEETRSRTARDGRSAALEAARADRQGREFEVARIEAQGQAEIEAAEVALQQAQADVANQRAALLRLESRLSRQENQLVRAPRAGAVLRVMARQGGEQVRVGDALIELVPDAADRAVEIIVDGNDVPLLSIGRHVRLQFEGWPAVQFAGWPSVAVGTFGGTIVAVDATDDGYGDFRILVEPEGEWPSPDYLRQGVRANGWFMLDQVSLGFELWRRFNGFPPVLQHPAYSPDGTPQPVSIGGGK